MMASSEDSTMETSRNASRSPARPGVFRLKPGKAETKLTGKRQRDFDFRIRETMWRIIVRHELADQFAILLDRNKRNRTDALARNRLLQLVRKIGRRDVLEIDRLRILLIPVQGECPSTAVR